MLEEGYRAGTEKKDSYRASHSKVRLEATLSVERNAVVALLKQQTIDNQAWFSAHGSNNYHSRIVECCQELTLNIDLISGSVKTIQEASYKCDYDEHTPGNGFRSLVCICDTVMLQLVAIMKNCSDNRNSIMFRSKWICKEMESFAAIFRFLILAFQHVVFLLEDMPSSSLFPPLDSDYMKYSGVLKGIENLDASCFYGRSFGFQFSPSVTRIFRLIGIVLATYSLSWDNGSAAFSSLMASSRFLLSPEQRAHRIIKVTREADIEFCRGFWNLSEIPAPKYFCPSMAVYQMVHIPMMGPLKMEKQGGGVVMIPEPSSHGPPAPIKMRLFSSVYREGIATNPGCRTVCPASPNLVVHCHGGGYVATTSKSHETYLRSWAKDLGCPLVSIEYSLSPEFPFPRPTEEVLYAFAWMLNNPEKVGWTGKKIVFCGDSAGGNLIVSTSLKLIELGTKKRPDGLVPIYTPFLFQYLPSPSRVLSFMDPLLHMGVVIRCAAAYTNACPNGTKAEQDRREAEEKAHVHHKSLLEYVDEINKQKENMGLFNLADFGSQPIVSLVNLTETSLSTMNMFTPNNTASITLDKIVESEANTSSSSDETRERSGNDSGMNTNGEEEDEEAEAQPNITLVHVDGDPNHICLSANNYDHHLLDYLQSHPLTKDSLQPLSVPTLEEDDDAFETSFYEDSDDTTPVQSKSFTAFSTPNNKISLSNKKRVTQTERPAKTKVTRGRSLSQSLLDTASQAAGHAYDSFSNWFEGEHAPLGHVDKPKLTRSKTMSVYESALIQQAEAEKMESCFTELLKLDLPREYLISPMYTPDEILKQLPPTYFIACHLDPLLDDTVSFARRLRNAGGTVKSVDLLDALPHGFLNFTPMSKECHEGAHACLRRIKEALLS
ncbi:unnamed protein product [Bursaphelenchus okinawaensis]|uniref:Hormone-sensitive lipase n=1 Tax=Bursaphelenchus okinawaensis TaxID=465554 RepID=A0A811KMD0_9BILA|nr:unnamed protein product [Bursaphelenchus okinawaensis]CAG9105198.1 unnamed protein product [Bursaphelenchus okinawaensis]